MILNPILQNWSIFMFWWGDMSIFLSCLRTLYREILNIQIFKYLHPGHFLNFSGYISDMSTWFWTQFCKIGPFWCSDEVICPFFYPAYGLFIGKYWIFKFSNIFILDIFLTFLGIYLICRLDSELNSAKLVHFDVLMRWYVRSSILLTDPPGKTGFTS